MATFTQIMARINSALAKFNKKIPASQQSMLDAITMEIMRLEEKDGRLKTTVKNLQTLASIKQKMLKVIVTDDYLNEVTDFANAFRELGALQNEYWKGVEKKYKPKSILKEIRNQAIGDTVEKLTETGIAANIGDTVTDILTTNITTGGAIKDLTAQVKEVLTNTEKSPGLLSRYAKQITTDSINQYNANYTQVVSSDIGYEWYAYQGSDIATTRPFCDAMTDRRYFHVSEIPSLLRGEGLEYTDKETGELLPVPIYSKTGLPNGLIEGTDASNFLIRRGGYNCGHQIRPVSERLVKAQNLNLYNQVIASPAYQSWLAGQTPARQEVPAPEVPETPPLKDEVKPVDPPTAPEEVEEDGKISGDYDLAALIADETENFAFTFNEDEATNDMTKDLQKQFPDMKKEEFVAIRLYGDHAYHRMNNALRGTGQNNPYIDNLNKATVSALNKIPDFKGTVYRGGNFPKARLDEYKKGAVVLEKGFTSTSKNPSSAFAGNTLFVIKSKSGKLIDSITEYDFAGGVRESEVLFAPGAKFKVIDVDKQAVTDKALLNEGVKERTVITLEEV